MSVIASVSVEATQHLVSPGDDWSRLAGELRPGDEVILMPGRHRAAQLTGVAGTADQPIVIRPIDPGHPVVIGGRDFGIHLIRPEHVVIQDVTISGAAEHGILVEGGSDGDATSPGDHWNANVHLVRITIANTMPEDDCVGIALNGVQNLRLQDVTVQRWMKSAVNVIGCNNVEFRNCRFEGHVDDGALYGVSVRGGSTNIRLNDTSFLEAGLDAFTTAEPTSATLYRPALPETSEPATRHTAERIRLHNCLFVGSDRAIVFSGAKHCSVNQCTVVNPTSRIMACEQGPDDRRIGPSGRIQFGQNLVVYNSAGVRAPVVAHAGMGEDALIFEWNLWWDEGGAGADLTRLPGVIAFEQTVDVDPELDANYRSTAAAAREFGIGVASQDESRDDPRQRPRHGRRAAQPVVD